MGAYKIVRRELEKYGADLTDKVEIIGLNKIDAVEPADLKKIATKLKRASKSEILMLSGASGEGIPAVLDRLTEAVGPAARAAAGAGEEDKGWSPI